MVRVEGWELRLSDYILKSKDIDFKWGKNDCTIFAAKALEVITGIDYYSQYLVYSTKDEAQKIIDKNGGFESLISKHLGNPHNKFMNAKRGDLALVKCPDICLGFIDDSGSKVLVLSEKGYVRIPLNKAFKIWSY